MSDLSLRVERLEGEVSELRWIVAELRSELGKVRQSTDQQSAFPLQGYGGGGRVALSPAGGIPAMVGAVPGMATGVEIYDHDPDSNTLSLADDAGVVFNTAGAVAGLVWIQVKQVQASYFVDVEACPPAARRVVAEPANATEGE